MTYNWDAAYTYNILTKFVVRICLEPNSIIEVTHYLYEIAEDW